MTTKDILDSALALPPAERAEVARELIASLDGVAEQGAEDAWLAEVERRLLEVDSGTARTEDWEAVRSRVAARLRSR
jgi:putative addiction module component (TIGR02574 family)